MKTNKEKRIFLRNLYPPLNFGGQLTQSCECKFGNQLIQNLAVADRITVGFIEIRKDDLPVLTYFTL